VEKDEVSGENTLIAEMRGECRILVEKLEA
jgi:hypothetical protein